MDNRPVIRASFRGTGGTLFGIQLVNFLLSIITLGIYSFWGRSKVRKFLWSSTEFDGDRFSYHGTGGELLKGYFLAILIFFGFGILMTIAQLVLPIETDALTAIAITLATYFAIFAFIGFAQVGARRYRLTRTSWRGIRFAFDGLVGDFLSVFVPGIILSTITLGIYTPYFQNNVRRFFTDHTRFGTGQFQFDGDGRDLLGRFLLALVLTIPTLGLYWFWYYAYRSRYYWSHTYFEDTPFISTVTGGALLGLVLTNVLLIVFTFGIGTPWAIVRSRVFVAENIMLDGDIDLSMIVQDSKAAGSAGEGVSELVDMGGVDLGGAF